MSQPGTHRSPVSRRWLGRLAIATLLLGSALAGRLRAERVVAIGDIHGDLDSLLGILHAAELTDAQGNWTGGASTLVQTGDFLDRGSEVRGVMDLLMKLQIQAPESGGRVIVLMGNHEAMNLLGFRRDVNPAIYESFREPSSAERQDTSWRAYTRWRRQRARLRKEPRPVLTANEERLWKAQFPLGYFEYQDQVGPDGEYGRWLRTLPAIVEVDETVFLHGGIPPSLSAWGADRINRETWTEVEELDACRAQLLEDGVIHESSDPGEMAREGVAELRSLADRVKRVPSAVADLLKESARVLERCVDFEEWFLIKEDSPLWFRGYARWTESEGAVQVAELLADRGARHFVVAHTPQKGGRIGVRFDGRVLLIDTGMLSSFYRGGRASALEIDGGVFTAIYTDGRERLKVSADRRITVSPRRFLGPDEIPLPFDDDDEVLDFLQTATILSREKLSQGINRPLKVLLERGSVQAYAVFRTVNESKTRYRNGEGRFFAKFKDSYRFEPAAYWVSRTLGMDSVPPAILRSYQGRPGSLQLWIHNVMDEKTRLEEGLSPPDAVYWLRQRAIRKLFDNLIQNFDRNQGNMLIDLDSWRVWLIDHTRSFLEERTLPSPDSVVQCDREVWERLRTVDLEEVRARLDPMLTEYEIDALTARWQLLVDLLADRIEQHGEEVVLFDIESAIPAGH